MSLCDGIATIGLSCQSGHHWTASARYDPASNLMTLVDGSANVCPEPTCRMPDTDAVWRCAQCNGLFDWMKKAYSGGRYCWPCHVEMGGYREDAAGERRKG